MPMTHPVIQIGDRHVGPGYPCYVIAEISGNHNGRIDTAIELVHAAKRAGADAVKLQTYTADTMTLDCDTELFQVKGGTLWDGTTLHKLYRDASTPWEWQPKLKQLADELEIHLFSSPFDPTSVDFLKTMHVPAYKVASFEIVDIPLIRRMARTGKPLIVSTGMATLSEIDEAVAAIRGEDNNGFALLKCTSAYPANAEDMNLRTIPHLAEAFQVPVGLSDHSLGTAVPVAAVALGACIVEKHITHARAEGGPDASFSLEPEEFQSMVESIRTAENALGMVHYGITEREAASRVFRRSLFAVRDIEPGEPFTTANVRSIRPGGGLHPRYLDAILKWRAGTRIVRGTPLQWRHVAYN
jgi:pseudaminic acid synthase